MKKSILAGSMAIFLMSALPAMGAKAYRSMELRHADGTTLLVNIEKEMNLTFSDSTLQINTPDYVAEFPLNDLNGWGFSTEWSSVSLKPEPPAPEPIIFDPVGDGTADTPYNIPGFYEAESDTALWVTGFIVGSYPEGTDFMNLTKANHSATNILLAPQTEELDLIEQYLFVHLDDSIAADLNLAANPENFGREISLKGMVDLSRDPQGMTDVILYEWGNKGKEPITVTPVDPIEPDPNSIEDVTNATPSFALTPNNITLTNLPDNSKIAIYDINGRCLKSVTASGTTTISLDSISRGTYILSINGKTVKISAR